MVELQNIIQVLVELLPNIGMIFFLWGVIDTYFLIRHGGNTNRGFTIWHRSLTNSERQFLSSLTQDIVDQTKVGLWRTKTSFIMKRGEEVLIRYSSPSQNTSWPLIGYVNLTSPECVLQYRSSFVMLLAGLLLAFVHIYVFCILAVAFILSWLFETGGMKNYLAQKMDRYFIKLTSQKQNG